MAILKCKMCGGDLDVSENETVAVCEYCGTKQTLPRLDDDRRANLYDRAGHFRRANDFDKAAGIYEQILSEDKADPEAYWSLVLCKYGIEYVEDPASHKRLPTVNRVQFTSVLADEDYKSALRYADAKQRNVYEEEARAIDKIQKDILAISRQEKPFDIFICYKEADTNGRRTPDSVLAQELYQELTQEGFRVFFSRITLEDKLGTAYEPYIFAALNSARVMVVLGTKAEYFNAVWVKNEWSRYLGLIKNGAKKTLIPAYRDMDPYDLPDEFSHLQAQDMAKLGFMQDLIRGIKKILGETGTKPAEQPMAARSGNGADPAALLRRAFIFLEDGKWKDADEYCERVLDSEPENAEAYLGKLMAEKELHSRNKLASCHDAFCFSDNYKKAVQFGNPALQEELRSAAYRHALQIMENAESPKGYNDAADEFKTLAGYRDADEKCSECRRTIEKRKEQYTRQLPLVKPYVQGLLSSEDFFLKADGTVVAVGKNTHEQCNVSGWRDVVAIDVAYGDYAVIGLRSDGTVVATGCNGDGQCNVFGWRDIVSISVGFKHTVGLRSDGTVVAVGFNGSGQCNVSDWQDIVAIDAEADHTVGLRSDGTVVAVGSNYYGQCNVFDWQNIVAINSGFNHTVGLKSDGTVVAVGYNKDGRCNVSGWRNVVAVDIGFGGWHTVGLKSDGTAVAVGSNQDGQCNVSDWRDILSINSANDHTVGLRSDGTVVAAGKNDYGQCDVSDWQDIVAINSGIGHTEGLKLDGTVVAVGKKNKNEDHSVEGMRLFDSPEQLRKEQELLNRRGEELREEYRQQEKRAHQEQQAKLEAECASLEIERGSLTRELKNLKGLFTGKRRRSIETRQEEIETRLAKIREELKKLTQEDESLN